MISGEAILSSCDKGDSGHRRTGYQRLLRSACQLRQDTHQIVLEGQGQLGWMEPYRLLVRTWTAAEEEEEGNSYGLGEA